MLKRLFASAALALSLSLPAQAAPIIYNTGGAPVDIPGLTGFATTGAMMDGMRVVACFSVAGCAPALFWSDGVAPASGGVTGNGWSLSVTGDTFNVDAWTFTFDDPNQTVLGQLVSLLLDGSTGLTIFDRTEPSTGTPGSERGRDFDTAVGGLIDVLYSGPTGVGGVAPVGDLFQSVLIEFRDAAGPRTTFVFSQDTDNDSRFQVPEPGSLALLAIAALGLGLARRRR